MKYRKKIIKTEDGSITYRIDTLKENYHSLYGAVTESQFVYLAEGFNFWSKNNNDQKCDIFELGYGTGLIAYLTFLEANKISKSVNYYSIDPFPLSIKEVKLLKYDELFEHLKSLTTFNEFSDIIWNHPQEVSPYFDITKNKTYFQDFKSQKLFDLIYYDAFGAHSQPEIWDPQLMKKCYKLLKPGGIWVSYCAKGSVRRGLQDAGFTVYRLPGPPGKREMLRAVK